MKEDVTRALSANVALIHTNLIKNTEEHERDNRKYDSSRKSIVLRELVFHLSIVVSLQ